MDALLLFDRRENGVYSPETAEATRADAHALLGSQDRLAHVFASALAKLQVQRIVDHPGACVFTDVGEAEAWLLDRTAD